MSLFQRVKEHFGQAIQTNILMADSLADTISAAGQKMAQAIIQGHKILSCGDGSTAALSNYFSAQLIHRFSMERPALPAIALTANTVNLSAIIKDQGYQDLFSQQINALGQAGDILLCLSTNYPSTVMIKAMETAHEKNMHIISLTGKDNAKLSSINESNHVEICIPSAEKTAIIEGQLGVIHCLCEAIDGELFGA